MTTTTTTLKTFTLIFLVASSTWLSFGRLAQADTAATNELQPGTIINMAVSEEPFELIVQKNHKLIVPNLPPVDVSGLTLEQARQKISELYTVSGDTTMANRVRLSFAESTSNKVTARAVTLKQSEASIQNENPNPFTRIELTLANGIGNFYGGNHELAERCFDAAVNKNSDDEYTAFYRASNYNSLKKWRLAADEFSRLLDLNPKCNEAYLHRATAYHQLGETKKAKNDLEYLLTRKPGFSNHALNNLGVIATEEGRFDEALNLFERSVALRPGAPRTWYLRGLLYQTIGETEKAKSDFAKAKELGFDSEP